MLAADELVKSTLIRGDPEICKALLFEVAVSYAKEGKNVYYFLSKPFESLPLAFHDKSKPSADALRLITFIHTPTYDDLANQLVRLHTFHRPASLLLIDELDKFAGPSFSQAARCCALLLHAARSCAGTAGWPVRVCAISWTEDVQLQKILTGYFDGHWIASSAGLQPDSDEARSVWIREAGGRADLELFRLDDPVLVITKIFAEERPIATIKQSPPE